MIKLIILILLTEFWIIVIGGVAFSILDELQGKPIQTFKTCFGFNFGASITFLSLAIFVDSVKPEFIPGIDLTFNGIMFSLAISCFIFAGIFLFIHIKLKK